MTTRVMFEFRILGLFRILCRNIAVWSGLALTLKPQPICSDSLPSALSVLCTHVA